MAQTVRSREWGVVPAPVLETFEEVFRALSEVVHSQVQSLGSAVEWHGPGATVDDTTDLRASVERVGVLPERVMVQYGRRVQVGATGYEAILASNAGPLKLVRMTVWHRPYRGGGTCLTLEVHGDDVDATHGFFNSVVNRLDAAVARVSKPAQQMDDTLTPAQTGWRGRISAFWRHPTSSQIVGSLVATGILAVIGAIWATKH
jgi:hypothetical protein